MALTAEEWNARYLTGTTVRYWGGARQGPGRLSKTRTEAYVYDSSNGPMVGVEGRSGGFALSHVEPVEATDEDWRREYRLRELDAQIKELNRQRMGVEVAIELLQQDFKRIQNGEIPV